MPRLPAWFRERVEPTPDHQDLRVSTLELFVDLVFVFTATQFTALIAHDLGHGIPRTLVMFGVVWWMFAGYAWLTNSVPPTRPARRLLLLGGMAGWLIVALSVPSAFEPGQVAFAAGMLVVVLVHGAMYLQFTTRFRPMLLINLGAVGLVLAAQLVTSEPLTYALWIAAVLAMWGSPYVIGQEGFPLHPGHIVERHGLVVIVALGESIVAIGVGARDLPVDADLIVAALLGLALSACLWWAHFSADMERAEENLRAEPDQVRRTRMVLFGLFYAFVPILLGIVALAAGIEHAIGHATAPASPEAAGLIAGGVAAFLLGSAAFRRALSIPGAAVRGLLAVPVVLTVPIGTLASAGVQLASVVVILAGTLAIEHRRAAL